MPRLNSCQYDPRWLLEPVITSVFQHQEGENWRRKTCHFLLRTSPRNCISLFCFYSTAKNLSQMARFGYREVEKCKSYSMWCHRFNLLCHGLYIGTAKWMEGQIWRGIHSCRTSYFSHIWIFGLSQGSLIIAFAKYLFLLPCLQTCCFLCLKCFQVVFYFKVQLKLNSYFFVKLTISLAYKCTALPIWPTEWRDNLISCYSM